jgi:hypothetical protein
MAQGFSFGLLKSLGIVPCVFLLGFVLCKFNIMSWLGSIAILASILIGIGYAVLGFIGILQNMEILEIKKVIINFENIFKKKKIEGEVIEQK